MTEQTPFGKPRPESDKGQAVAAKVPPAGETGIPSVDEPVPVHQLSPAEQMARFEKELKEKDWGHQPC
jgi:hypothetical protein